MLLLHTGSNYNPVLSSSEDHRYLFHSEKLHIKQTAPFGKAACSFHIHQLNTERKKYKEKWDQGKEITYYVYSSIKVCCVEAARRHLPMPPSNQCTRGRHPQHKPRGAALGSVAKGNLALIKDQKKARSELWMVPDSICFKKRSL